MNGARYNVFNDSWIVIRCHHREPEEHALSHSVSLSINTAVESETALFQTCGFTPEFAQVVDFSPPYPTSGDHFDFVNDRRMQWKYAFDTHAI